MKKIKTLFHTTALTICSISAIASTAAYADNLADYQGEIISIEEANKIATDHFGDGNVTETDFDDSDDDNGGKPVYEIDFTKPDGTEHEIKIDATDGRIVESKKDN